MTVSDDTVRYTPGAVNGSIAYDTSRFRTYTGENPNYDGSAAPEYPPREEPGETSVPKAKPSVRRQPEQYRLHPVALLGLALVAGMAVLILLGNLRLTRISAETAELELRLQELQRESSTLRVEYEYAFDLREIEEYAVRELGMTRLSSDQVTYLTGLGGDWGEVLTERQDSGIGGIAEETGSIWQAVKEYLHLPTH